MIKDVGITRISTNGNEISSGNENNSGSSNDPREDQNENPLG
jgi:hypothetical protein